jgi:hypothetical protein
MSATHGRGAGGAHAGLVIGVADQRAHRVSAGAEQRRQAQRDPPVAAGDDDRDS